MQPDRDTISAARLFRFHVVANGSPGTVLDSTGRQVDDFHQLNTTASIGSMDLDATWVHENLPGPQQCPGVGKLCAAYPGIFELPVGGCGHAADNFSRCHVLGGGNAKFCSGLAHCKSRVGVGVSLPGDSTIDGPTVFLVRSVAPETHSARAALRTFGVVPYRDGIFAARQGLNSLRQTASTTRTCSFPDNGNGTASFDRPLTCQPGTVSALSRGSSFTPATSVKAPANDSHMYVDAKAMIYDMQSTVGSSSPLVNSSSGQVKVAVGLQNNNLTSLIAELKLARADGAQVALLTEENFGGTAEPMDGPHVTGLRAAAKALSLFIVVPLRLSIGKGRNGDPNFNAAVVIDTSGELLNSTAGVPFYQKVMPSGYFPAPTRLPSLPNDYPEGVVPGLQGVQAWNLPGIGRVAILICFDINFFELWHQAYALG